MGLREYKKKRNFRRTPEPPGRADRQAKKSLSFVVQKHAASHLHYDFRLEWQGVLKSWAVPKGPSLDPTQKRLAVHVEDHPLEYGKFEGVIPKGQYGAGTVKIWDKGTWEPYGDVQKGLHKGHLVFGLRGKKLKGDWALIQMKGSRGDGKNWLLMKTAKSSRKKFPPAPRIRSVPDTGKTVPMPAFISPQLATLVDKIPTGEGWIHEVKFDGYRALTKIQDSKVRIFTRNKNDWTDRFQKIADEFKNFPVRQAWLDGEVVKLLPSGLSSFQALQNSLKEGADQDLHYFVFDLLYWDGRDTSALPLEERRDLLESLLEKITGKNRRIRFSDALEGQAGDIFDTACRLGLEGVVSKRADLPYESGRSRHWLKVKCHEEQEFVIVGYTEPGGSRKGFGALLLGLYEKEKKLRYAGMVGTGFTQKSIQELHRQLRRLEQDQPTVALPRLAKVRKIHWVKPELVANVQFTEWTEDNVLRHPSFDGLREDKSAAKVREEKPMTSTKGKDSEEIAGVTLSHPQKILYPDQKITKRDLAEYYLQVADKILPHIQNRPLSLVRCPEGSGKKCFYQKHFNAKTPSGLGEVEIAESSGKKDKYILVNDETGLVTLAQMAVLEIHPWGARADDIEHPDLMIFDLDPDPSVPWKQVKEGAQLLRLLLKEFNLESFLKTTGGKGLHVVVPLARKYSWEEMKGASKAIAQMIVKDDPKNYTSELRKAKRRGKIFLDYLRNTRGATAVAPYSTRARPTAPIALPLFWEELPELKKPDQYPMKKVFERLKKQIWDPWKKLFTLKQSLSMLKKKLGSLSGD